MELVSDTTLAVKRANHGPRGGKGSGRAWATRRRSWLAPLLAVAGTLVLAAVLALSVVYRERLESWVLRRAGEAPVDPEARELDEGSRFTLCQPDPLADLFRRAGLHNVEVRAIDVPTVFRDFDDYWSPFLAGQVPAPAYAMSLSQERRTALRDRIRTSLPTNTKGEHHLTARAWAVRGVR